MWQAVATALAVVLLALAAWVGNRFFEEIVANRELAQALDRRMDIHELRHRYSGAQPEE